MEEDTIEEEEEEEEEDEEVTEVSSATDDGNRFQVHLQQEGSLNCSSTCKYKLTVNTSTIHACN